MDRGVPRWLLFILNSEIYFPYSSSTTGSSDSRNLTTFDELQAILWRDRRVGLCQWREIIYRRLRNRFPGGGFPRDFELGFRESALRLTNPVVLPTGILGRPIILSNWETVTSGVNNPREDGADNLDVDGDYDAEHNGSICISLRTSGTPANARDRETSEIFHIPTSEDGDDFLPTLEIDEDVGLDPQVEPNVAPVLERDNHNEAIIPPLSSEVLSARLSDFRCGGGPVEYPAPNGMGNVYATSEYADTLTMFPSHCGGLGDIMKKSFGVLFSDTKLEALFSGLSDSPSS